jgi:hypothetical protein
MTYWLNTVNRDHVRRGAAGGYVQDNHRNPTMLRKMCRGDWIAFYSPRTAYRDGVALEAFTAIAQVIDDEPYQVEIAADLHPWRRRADFLSCTETPIQPLLLELRFIKNPHSRAWFRVAGFVLDEHDFMVIRRAMDCSQ